MLILRTQLKFEQFQLEQSPYISYLFVTSRCQWEAHVHPISIYIHSFIISKASHNSFHFHSGWLLSRNLGILNIQTVKRGIYRRKSANVWLTCILKYVPDVILDRKSFSLWKDINACGNTHKHTQRHTERHTYIRTQKEVSQ